MLILADRSNILIIIDCSTGRLCATHSLVSIELLCISVLVFLYIFDLLGPELLARLSCIMRNYVDGIGTRSLDNLEENY